MNDSSNGGTTDAETERMAIAFVPATAVGFMIFFGWIGSAFVALVSLVGIVSIVLLVASMATHQYS